MWLYCNMLSFTNRAMVKEKKYFYFLSLCFFFLFPFYSFILRGTGQTCYIADRSADGCRRRRLRQPSSAPRTPCASCGTCSIWFKILHLVPMIPAIYIIVQPNKSYIFSWPLHQSQQNPKHTPPPYKKHGTHYSSFAFHSLYLSYLHFYYSELQSSVLSTPLNLEGCLQLRIKWRGSGRVYVLTF